MKLDDVVIVLDRPEEPRNIGAVCRAMANNGIHDLRIIADKSQIDEEKVHVLAIHAGYIYDNAKFYSSITEATADCVFSAGTTRRKGKKRGKLYLPEEFTKMTETFNGKVAVVFGNERTGLTEEEVDECTAGVTIPSSEEFGSLNLSHAVQIICYHLFRAAGSTFSGVGSITLDRIDQTTEKIASSLEQIGFFKVTGRDDMKNFWRSVLSRAALTESEAQYIEKTFSKAAGLAGKNKGE